MRRAAIALVALLPACSWEGTWAEPTPGLHRMIDQPRVDTYEGSSFFENGAAMRAPPDGTVPWGAQEEVPPPAMDPALLARGQDRFAIFCAPCHGLDARAHTVVAEDMDVRKPPALIERRIVALADADIYRVVTEGFGVMPSYADRLAPADRWAVVAYVRALQLAAGAPLDLLSPADRRALARSGP